MQLDQIPTPALPIPPQEYDRLYQQQGNNVLRLFFNRISTALNAVLGTHGGRYISNPAGSFSSASTQTTAGAATPTRVTFSTSDFSSGVHYHSGNGIYADISGVYNLQFSVQVTNSDTKDHDIDIWLRKNGVDVANTASVATIASTHGGIIGYHVLAANFFISLEAGDYIELWWAASATSVKLEYLPAITTPFISPGSPSAVVTLVLISAI